MRTVKIPKKSGGKRTIYVQNPWEKHNYRYYGQQLAEFYEKNGNGVAHGFVSGKSPVTNAQAHIGKKFTLSFDLKDFFDTVTKDHLIRAGVDEELAKRVCYNGATRQGLSSSPTAANCAAIPLDKKIENAIISNKGENFFVERDIVYTRYADDLTFSSDNLESLIWLRDKIVPGIVKECGFVLNDKKTRIQSSKFGRRIITGVAVDDNVYPRRKQRKILRAATYNIKKLNNLLSFLVWVGKFSLFALILEINRKNVSKYLGLKEWCKLKQPTKSLGGKLISTAIRVRTKEAFND